MAFRLLVWKLQTVEKEASQTYMYFCALAVDC
jgi:hypothetical protein